MKYSVKKFIGLVDRELKQNENSHRTKIDDSMRKAKEQEIINWLNQALNEFSIMNEMHWYGVKSYYPTVSSTTLELPYYLKRLDKLFINDKWYNVGYHTTTNSDIYWEGGNFVRGNKVSFIKDQEIKLMGIFYPDEVIDENSTIDFPVEFIRLLVLKVLIYESSRTNKRTDLWFSQMRTLERQFKQSASNVNASSTVKPLVGFAQ